MEETAVSTVETAPKKKDKMDVGSAIAYSVGFGGTNVIWYMINNYLMLFYTDVVTLSAGAISTILLVARIWDAINDPMMGAIVDRTHTRWGKFKPYIVLGAPFLAIFNILTFTVWPLEGATKAVVCLLTYIGVGMAYTVLQVTINGLVNRLSNSSQIKMDIISMAQVVSSVIQTILGAVAMPLILFFSKSDVANGTGFNRATIVFSVIAIPMFWYCAWRCHEVKEEKTVPAETSAPVKQEKQPLSKSLKSLIKNKMVLICVAMVFFGAMAAIARMSLLSYYLIYVAGAYQYIAPTFTIISLLQIVGNMLLPFFTRKVGKIRWFVITMCLNALSMIILFFAPAGNVPILLLCSGLYGITNSATSVSYSMLCDSVEYGDYMFGVRDDALAFSFQSFGVKVAQAVTGSIGVLALAAVGYVANAEQTPQAMTGINVIVNLAPAILTLLSLLLMVFYKLDEKTMDKIRVTLEARRAGNMLPDDPLNTK